MQEFVQVITTTNNEEVAKKIAQILLEKKLAGCVQIIGPINSLYWWKGKIEEDKEFLIFIKSSKSLYKEIEKEIKAVHNYEVPEILCQSILDGNPDYLSWLKSVIQSTD
ncbi:MAG: divalent-cation tolerance protein CutA [Candidatus Hydrothermia bacterium]